MTSDRRPSTRANPQPLNVQQRKLRYSIRYNTYQVLDRWGNWRNVNEPMYRAYAAAGLRVEENQQSLF